MVVAGGGGVALAAHACRLFSQEGELLGSLACSRPVVGVAAAADGTVAVLAAGRGTDGAPLLPETGSQLHVLRPGAGLPPYPLRESHTLTAVASSTAKELWTHGHRQQNA